MTKQGDFVPRRDYGRRLPHKEGALPSTVPVVGLGCSSFSTFFWTDDQEREDGKCLTVESMQRSHPIVQGWVDAIHHAVLHHGIDLLDTAPWYGHGTSEMVVGWALHELLLSNRDRQPTIHRQDICINTKVGRYEADPKRQFDFSREMTMLSVKRSLARLGGDVLGYIDVLQLHDPEFAQALDILMEETIPAMIECRDMGWCKALGMTGYPLEVQYQVFQATFEKYGDTTVWDQALTYCHFNLHDQSLVQRRITNGSTINYDSFASYCQQHNMGLLAAAPLSMGLLTHNAIAQWHPALGTKLEEACHHARQICVDHEVDIATLALVFAMSHPQIPCTILGMKNVEQVNTAAALARRFHVVDYSRHALSQEDILKQVLTEAELQVYQILNDKKSGPFAELYREQSATSNPLYQWDGVEEAHKFWEGVDGAKCEDWQLRYL